MANEIHLYGTVGQGWWDEDWFTAASVRQQLQGLTGPLTVRINSGGGIATEGQAIYTMLVDYPDHVTVVVDGVAASAASLIAMAGDEIVMRMGSFMLIHDPAQGWLEGRGTEADHLKAAEHLAVIAGAYADIYAKRAGITREAARAIMADETLYDGPAAVAAGFATAYDGDTAAAAAARFDYRIYAHAPQHLREASKGLGAMPSKQAVLAMMAGEIPQTAQGAVTMAEQSTEGAAVDTVDTETNADATTVAPVQADGEAENATTATAKAATAAERERARRITMSVQMAGLPTEMAVSLIGQSITAEQAIDKITEKWKENGQMDPQMIGRPTARITADAVDKFKTGAMLALMAKAGVAGGERNEFSSMTLSELARKSIEMAGGRSTFRDRLEMVGAAFTMSGGQHSTSDFSQVLANVAQKAVLQGWEEAEETFDLWTRAGTLTDFRPAKRVGTGLFPALAKKAEGAEYSYGTVGDRGETITLATYGKIIGFTREAIINDDLSILGAIPRKMGRAAKRTIGDLVYAILTDSPTMSDGVALFHADHKNLAATGAALSVASLGAARTAMRTQKEKAGDSAGLNITPRKLLVPAALEFTAAQLLASAVDPTATKGHASNPAQGSAQLISDARLDAASATAWYMAADPNSFDTIEVAYLDGIDAPYIEEQTSWTRDGAEMKVRIDAGVAALDHRTLYKNPGA